MVNFRFHLVSLAAVFLALAAGIVIGAGVVDRQTVALLERRLEDVRENRNATNRENDELRTELGHWTRFSNEAGDRMVEGRLVGTSVLVVAVNGTSRDVVDRLRGTIGAAGATVEGTLWFTGKWSLANHEHAAELASLLEAPASMRPHELRTAALTRLVGGWVSGTGSDVVTLLRDRGFLEFQPEPATERSIEDAGRPGTTFVVVSARDADVLPADVALPVVAQLADAGVPVVAAQPVPPEDDSAKAGNEKAEPPAALASLVRSQQGLSDRVSSVDDVDDYRGRVATVLAIADLPRGRFGHYGVMPDAHRVLPEATP